MHARSQSSADILLIAAISGRALAAAARRAGYRPLVADFFRDSDTVAMAERTLVLPGDLQHGVDPSRMLETLHHLAGNDRPAAVILGSGFERDPDIVDDVARAFPLAGNRGATIRRVKDPRSLASDCAALGIPHPPSRWTPPPDPENWLTKTAGGAGGAHVRRMNGEPPAPNRYFQRFVAGRSVSALFVADGRSARVVGFSDQWTAPTPDTPYRYGGAARLRRVDRHRAATIGSWLEGLTRRTGLTGLGSADFIRNENGYHLVEINPRPGATLDIFDCVEAPLIEAHIKAARGEAYAIPNYTDAMASLVAYAPSPIARFPRIAWPAWTADHQAADTRVMAGDPVCTVFGRGPNASSARKAARARLGELQRYWEGDRT